MRKTVYLPLAVLITLLLFVPSASAPPGPRVDVLTYDVIRGPAARLASMIPAATATADVWPSMSVPIDFWSSILEEQNGGPRSTDIITLNALGFTVTPDPGFHTGAIVWNIRDTATINTYYRPVSYWPLHDVEFRHALIHCFNQLRHIATTCSWTVSPTRSLVPPAQSKYYSSSTEPHPYNPGNPFTSPSTEESTCGILKKAGYTFVDAGTIGVVDNPDYWRCPDGSPLPTMNIDTPLAGNAPSSDTLVTLFVMDLNRVGLQGTTLNGNTGLVKRNIAFTTYLDTVYRTAAFDACMIFYDVDRIPDQLYYLLRTSQDSRVYPYGKNAAGVNNPTIDALAHTVEISLDLDEIEEAAKQIQEMMYDPTLSDADNFALSYMCLYSRAHFNTYNPNLAGIVKSPGYGSDNKWTYLNVFWTGIPRRNWAGLVQVKWMVDEEPTTLNPTKASTKCDWEFLAGVYDGLTNRNPYNHHDIPWIATDWEIRETLTGMEIDYTLRDDVFWQDGYQFTAYDVEFCLEFLRDYQVPRFGVQSYRLVDVVVTDPTHLTIIASEASVNLFYDYSGLAAMLPPQIWDRPWANATAILAYAPDTTTYGTDMAPGYSPGPWATSVPTNLFGTGPWIFQFYDPTIQTSDLYANRNYFMTTTDISSSLTEMFWQVGDYNRDGIIDVNDKTYVSFAYGCHVGDPLYDADADFNSDGIVDVRDLSDYAYHETWQKTYP